MQILLTGATGFVGAAILRRLAKEDVYVRVLIRDSSNRSNISGYDPEIFIGDLRDKSSLLKAMDDCDVLIHTAAEYRLWSKNPEEMIEANVTGTANILEAAADSTVSKVVYTSSVAALGKSADSTPVTETTPSQLADKIGTYKRSKFLAEEEALTICRERGLPLVIVNPSAPIGPGDIKPTPTGRMVVEAAKGKVPAYVDSGLNVVHVDDVAEGHWLALQKGKPGEKYILGGENLSLLQILTLVTNAANVRPPRFKIPHNVILPIAYASEFWARWITHKEPFTTVDGVRMSKTPMYFSSEKAKNELGYSPRPVQSAFEESVAWFRNNGYLN